jgi:hypothetical protein
MRSGDMLVYPPRSPAVKTAGMRGSIRDRRDAGFARDKNFAAKPVHSSRRFSNRGPTVSGAFGFAARPVCSPSVRLKCIPVIPFPKSSVLMGSWEILFVSTTFFPTRRRYSSSRCPGLAEHRTGAWLPFLLPARTPLFDHSKFRNAVAAGISHPDIRSVKRNTLGICSNRKRV